MAIGVVGVVETTAQQTVSQGNQLGGFFGACYQTIHKVHRIWRWYRFTEVYTNPDNLLSLVAGHGLNWLGGGDSMIVNIAAQVLLIATRITECVEEQVKVVRETRLLWDEITDPYLLCPKVKWKHTVGKSGWLSPSTEIWLKETFVWLVDRIKRIAKRILVIGKRLFFLSMKTLDAAEAFSYSNNRNERVNQLFVNSRKCLKVLVENKDLLLHGIKKHKSVIKQILGNANSMFTVDQLINVIKKTVGVAESVHNGIESASQAVGVFGRDLAKRAAFGLFQAAGLLDLMPNSWVPPRHPVWMEEQRSEVNQPRFLPIDDVVFVRSYQKLVDNEVDKEIGKLYKPKDGYNNIGYRFKCKSLEVKIRKRYAKLCRMPITEYRVMV